MYHYFRKIGGALIKIGCLVVTLSSVACMKKADEVNSFSTTTEIISQNVNNSTANYWELIHENPCKYHRHCPVLMSSDKRVSNELAKAKAEANATKTATKHVGIDKWIAYSNSPSAKDAGLGRGRRSSNSPTYSADSLTYKEFTRDYVIYFRMNLSQIEAGYKDNVSELRRMRRDIDSLLRINPESINKMKIRGTASPDGPYAFNKDLAHNRALSLKRYITDYFPQYDTEKIEVFSLPEDWITMREIVENDPDFPQREQVLELIDDEDTPLDRKEQQLRSMRTAFRYLVNNDIYKMRTSMVKLTIVMPVIYVEPVKDIVPVQKDTLFRTVYESRPQKQYQTIAAFKSNMLLPFLNVGVDIPIGNHFSLGLNYYYPWWLDKGNRYCAEMVGLFADAKYWFGDEIGDWGWTPESKLKGHAIGVYGGVGYYDYQWLRSGYQGEYFDVGLDYTYSITVGSHDQFRIEFNIGFGWIRTQRRHYTPTEDWEILIKDPGVKYEVSDFFGPTRAGVSFVWPIVVETERRRK